MKAMLAMTNDTVSETDETWRLSMKRREARNVMSCDESLAPTTNSSPYARHRECDIIDNDRTGLLTFRFFHNGRCD